MVIRYSRNALVASLLGAILGGVAAAPAEPLTLEQAMTRARSSAADVAAAQARQSAANAAVQEARSWSRPQLRIQEIWTRTDSPAEAFALLLNREQFSFEHFAASDPNSPAPLQAAITRLEAEMPLYTGGELSGRVRQAEGMARGAAESSRAVADQAALEAAKAWVQLAKAREFAALLERAQETVASHVERAHRVAEQGLIVRSEVLRSEVELARANDALLTARGEVRIAEAFLAFRLGDEMNGLESGRESSYTLSPLAASTDDPIDLVPWLEKSDGRPELAALRAAVDVAHLEAEVRGAAYRPKVGLLARWDQIDERPFGTGASSTSLTAVASFDLFDGGRRRARVAGARATAEAFEADLESYRSAIRVEVRAAYEAVVAGAERRRTAAAALEAAEETVRITEERFRAGVARTLDVLDAVTARREAQTRELVARADTQIARLQLARSAGLAPEVALLPTHHPDSAPVDPTPGGFQ